jgi:hypothetical protein
MRDGRKAEGAPFSECAVNPRASASGHVAATPLRSLHAHGAGARGITTGSPKSAGSGCHNALPASRRRPPVPAPAARGPSPRPPARGGGMRAARRAPHTCFAGRRSAEGAPFSSVPCIQHRRRAATSPRCRRAACTLVARLRRMIHPHGLARNTSTTAPPGKSPGRFRRSFPHFGQCAGCPACVDCPDRVATRITTSAPHSSQRRSKS